MIYFRYFWFLLLAVGVTALSIPFVSNVILRPRYLSNSTFVYNRSIEQCLCLSLPSFMAFNWFPNNTCQLFVTFPINYKIQSMPQARLYFPQRVFPSASQCCMPDLSYLLARLRSGILLSANVVAARNLILDNNGFIVTVGGQTPVLSRFDARNLSPISRTTLSGSYPMVVALNSNVYFVGFPTDPFVVIDSTTLTVVGSISAPYVQEVRGIMFFDDGRTMVFSDVNDQRILFFNRTSTSPPNYTFAYLKSVSYLAVHGLHRINDTFFYATSWSQNSVYSYASVANSASWTEARVIDARPMQNITGGAFVKTDECGRLWFCLDTSTVQIFDSQGTWLGNFSLPGAFIMDVLFTDNYVMYFSDANPLGSRIIRIDPQIQC